MIKYHNISLTFASQVVFQNFSFSVPEKSKLLIKGPSGCGKTSLLNMLLGFVVPDSGHISVDGLELNRQHIWQVRRRIALVSQDLQIGGGRVEEFIQEVLDYKANQHIQYSEEKVGEWFDKFQLPISKLQQEIAELSGGEKQRLALVIGLLLDREIYLLDEVTSAIDDELKATVIDHLASMENKTVVAVSHDKHWEDYDFKILDLGKQ